MSKVKASTPAVAETAKPTVKAAKVATTDAKPAADTKPVKSSETKEAKVAKVAKVVEAKVAVVVADAKPAGDVVKPVAKRAARAKSPTDKPAGDAATKEQKESKVSKPTSATPARAVAAKVKAAPPTANAKEFAESANQAEKSEKPKAPRVHNTKPTSMDTTGIGINYSRVRFILLNAALNPAQYKLTQTLEKASAAKTDISNLDSETVAAVQNAEAAYEKSMRESFDREDYRESLKTAQQEAEQKQSAFDLKAFEAAYESNREAAFVAYKAKKDNYVVNQADGASRHDQWSRASALVNKFNMRLSGNTRVTIACFVDRIVEQIAVNGIHNCIKDNRRTVMPHYALAETDGFNARVPLHRFIKTLDSYDVARRFIADSDAVRHHNKETKDAKEHKPMPSFDDYKLPSDASEFKFDGFIGEICRSVRMQMANKETDEKVKNAYLETSVSKEFRRLFSSVVYECILRIGAVLLTTAKASAVRTINDTMVFTCLENIHSAVGMDYALTSSKMSEALAKHDNYRSERRLKRASARQNGDDVKADDSDSEVQDDE